MHHIIIGELTPASLTAGGHCSTTPPFDICFGANSNGSRAHHKCCWHPQNRDYSWMFAAHCWGYGEFMKFILTRSEIIESLLWRIWILNGTFSVLCAGTTTRQSSTLRPPPHQQSYACRWQILISKNEPIFKFCFYYLFMIFIKGLHVLHLQPTS